MRKTIVIIAFFAVPAFAIIGCLNIFGVLSPDASKTLLLRSEAAILLLGGCAVLLALLIRGGAK